MSEAAAPRGLGLSAGPARLLSDERLVQRATSGDERAFAAIFRRYHQDLYRYCVAIVGDSQDAHDALQNTMVKVMRALPGESRQIRLKPWLYRIAHNEAIEVLRHRAPAEQLDPELAGTAPTPPEQAEQRAQMRRLVADMGELPERQRGALVMRELADLDFEEIGAALNTSPAVARQTLYEARLSLRQMEEGRELSCDEVMRAISDADGRVTRRRDLRAHLRECGGCREFAGEMRRRRADFAAIAPLPAVAAAGILQGIVGGAASGGAATAGAAGGAVAGKALGGSALGGSILAKSAVTVAVVAVIGVKVVDRSGLVDVGLPGGGSKDTPADARSGSAPAGQPRLAPSAPAKAAGGSETAKRAVGEGAAAPKAKNDPAQNPSTAGGPPPGAATGAPGDLPAAPGASDGHRQDAGRQGNPPSAADHGQGTAAAHKGGAGAPGQQSGNPSPPKKGQGKGSGAAPKEHPAQSQKPEPPPAPEPPPKPSAPAGPESAGGGKPAPPPETPAGPHSGPAGLD
jgi:RNA polymerase sigma factor (sigma-70 family)